jgi:hypothetical protein
VLIVRLLDENAEQQRVIAEQGAEIAELRAEIARLKGLPFDKLRRTPAVQAEQAERPGRGECAQADPPAPARP